MEKVYVGALCVRVSKKSWILLIAEDEIDYVVLECAWGGSEDAFRGSEFVIAKERFRLLCKYIRYFGCSVDIVHNVARTQLLLSML